MIGYIRVGLIEENPSRRRGERDERENGTKRTYPLSKRRDGTKRAYRRMCASEKERETCGGKA